ncbi:MAG: Trm112 family protein [Planctomycetota bacterium]
MAQELDRDLLDILVCPLTRTPLVQEGDWLVSREAGRRYPIRDGIPVLLIEEAEVLDEKKQWVRAHREG